MEAVLKKLHYKGQTPVLVLALPSELKPLAAAFGGAVHSAAKGEYGFVLGFAKSQKEAKAVAKTLKKGSPTKRRCFGSPTPKGRPRSIPAWI